MNGSEIRHERGLVCFGQFRQRDRPHSSNALPDLLHDPRLVEVFVRDPRSDVFFTVRMTTAAGSVEDRYARMPDTIPIVVMHAIISIHPVHCHLALDLVARPVIAVHLLLRVLLHSPYAIARFTVASAFVDPSIEAPAFPVRRFSP